MQGIVTLDFGNTHPHAGLFARGRDQWDLLKVVPLAELSLALSQFGMSPDNTSLVLSEVRAREEDLQPLIHQGFLLTRVKEYWRGERFAGMPVSYAKTLGEDRLIQAYSTFKNFKNTTTLIIDAGTYVTMDLVNSSGFAGGYIIPGQRIYFDSFQQGEQLRSFELQPEHSPSLPQDTHSAMAASYQAFGALANNLLEQHKVQKLLLTGGSASYWEAFFDDHRPSLVVEIAPHLIHSSLQYWFSTQIEPL